MLLHIILASKLLSDWEYSYFPTGCENRSKVIPLPPTPTKFARNHQFKHLAEEVSVIPKKSEPGQEYIPYM